MQNSERKGRTHLLLKLLGISCTERLLEARVAGFAVDSVCVLCRSLRFDIIERVHKIVHLWKAEVLASDYAYLLRCAIGSIGRDSDGKW